VPVSHSKAALKWADESRGAIRHIDFSPDGELIAIGGDDNFIAIVGNIVYTSQTGKY
jgi:WD40 repeat protein